MSKQTTKQIVLALTLLTLLSTAACGKKENHRRGRRQGPPPQAIAACKGKQAGDRIEFKGRQGQTVQATCRVVNGRLAAVPGRMRTAPGE